MIIRTAKHPIFVLIYFLWASSFVLADYKTWTSNDGVSIEAKIVAVQDGSVLLERADGAEFTVPVTRFSDDDQIKILSWTPPPIEVPSAEDAVMVLATEKGRGSGFLLQHNGRVYLYTNQHVLGDMAELTAKDLKGESIELGKLEIAKDRDLARLRANKYKGLLLGADTPQTGSDIVVYGNSQGSGVITRSDGKIVGLSPILLEVSSEIVAGNSGGPVVTNDDKVLAVSSFVTYTDSRLDPTVRGTRYEKPRRFALRLDNQVDFIPVAWDEFSSAYDIYEKAVIAYDEALQITRSLVESPMSPQLEDSYQTDSINRIARTHNRDIRRSPDMVYSELEMRNARRQLSRRLIRNLRDAYAIAETALSESSSQLDAEIYGWMHSELERRGDILPGWQTFLDQYFETIR